MAIVQLSNVIDVEVFNSLPADESTLLNNLMTSGIVVRDPLFDQHANAPGLVGAMNMWNDLDSSSEPNFSQDTETEATPDNVGQKELNVRAVHLNNGWKASDLARELQTNEDAMSLIRRRVDKYWDTQFQRRLIATVEGVIADNVANDLSDMVVDISVASDTNTTTAANFFSRQAFTNAVFTMGDHFDDIQAVAVHSVVYQNMVDNDDIDFIPDSTGSMLIPTYLGKRVIIDDQLVRDDADDVTADTLKEYMTMFFGAGAFAFGVGSPLIPTEIERNAAQGQGSGNEVLWDRKTWLLQPAGYSFTGADLVAGQPAHATAAKLKAAANWDRIVSDRKSVPFSALITNG